MRQFIKLTVMVLILCLGAWSAWAQDYVGFTRADGGAPLELDFVYWGEGASALGVRGADDMSSAAIFATEDWGATWSQLGSWNLPAGHTAPLTLWYHLEPGLWLVRTNFVNLMSGSYDSDLFASLDHGATWIDVLDLIQAEFGARPNHVFYAYPSAKGLVVLHTSPSVVTTPGEDTSQPSRLFRLALPGMTGEKASWEIPLNDTRMAVAPDGTVVGLGHISLLGSVFRVDPSGQLSLTLATDIHPQLDPLLVTAVPGGRGFNLQDILSGNRSSQRMGLWSADGADWRLYYHSDQGPDGLDDWELVSSTSPDGVVGLVSLVRRATPGDVSSQVTAYRIARSDDSGASWNTVIENNSNDQACAAYLDQAGVLHGFLQQAGLPGRTLGQFLFYR